MLHVLVAGHRVGGRELSITNVSLVFRGGRKVLLGNDFQYWLVELQSLLLVVDAYLWLGSRLHQPPCLSKTALVVRTVEASRLIINP